MGFHEDAIFPTNISYGSVGGPGFSTSIIELDSGTEERVARWSTARRRYNAKYGISAGERLLDDLYSVYEFYIARLGPAYGFKYKDWLDYTSSDNGRDSPDDGDQLIGTGDASETDFQLIKKYTSGGVTRTRNIEKPVSGTVIIAFDGIAQTSGWSVNTTTGIVTFTSAPGSGVDVTAGYEFYVPCRFGAELDTQLGIAIQTYEGGSIPDIPIVEIRDERPIYDEYAYGGAIDHGNISANLNITLAQGRVHRVSPTASSLQINLPALTNIPTGGPIFYIFNEGTYSITIKDSGGGTVIELPVDGTATLNVMLVSAAKTWVGK